MAARFRVLQLEVIYDIWQHGPVWRQVSISHRDPQGSQSAPQSPALLSSRGLCSPGQKEGSCHADPCRHRHDVGDDEVTVQDNHHDEEGDSRLQGGKEAGLVSQSPQLLPSAPSSPVMAPAGSSVHPLTEMPT